MSTKIQIGADELILWVRKNKKVLEVSNDGAQGLGRRIHDLIVKEFHGKKIAENYDAHLANLMDDKNVEKFNLPKTSAQYEIETQKNGQLYKNLSRW